MNKRKLVSLVLVVAMILAVVPLAMGAQEGLPTLRILMNNNGRVWVPESTNNVKLQEILGVKLDVTVAGEDTITLSFASGDLPDIISFPGLTYAEYVSTGYLLPLNDLLGEHGQDILSVTTDFAKKLCSIEGTIYTYPYENNNVKYFTYMRKDWLDKIGFDLASRGQVPESDIYNLSLEEYTQILHDFTFGDPDGNGANDTYGLSTYAKSNNAVSFMAIFGAFGGLMTQNYEKEGVVWPFETTAEYRSALEFLNTLWEAGVVDPEIFILEGTQAKTNVMNGKHGTFVGWWSTAYEMVRDGMDELQPGMEWCTAEIVGPEGHVGMKDNGRITSTVSITTACKDPALAMKTLNRINTDECWWLIRYGVEGEHYALDDAGYPTRTEAGTNEFQAMTLDTLYPLANRIDIENFANSAPQTDPKLHIRLGMFVHQFVAAAPLYSDLFYGLPQTQESMDYGVDVTNIVDKYCMQFITGEVELSDANWAEYLAKWQSMGGSDILASYVDAYNEVNGTSLVPAL